MADESPRLPTAAKLKLMYHEKDLKRYIKQLLQPLARPSSELKPAILDQFCNDAATYLLLHFDHAQTTKELEVVDAKPDEDGRLDWYLATKRRMRDTHGMSSSSGSSGSGVAKTPTTSDACALLELVAAAKKP